MPNPTYANQIFNMTLPPEGPRAIPVNVDLSASTEAFIDVTQLVDNGTISYISGAWIDNSNNAQELLIVVNDTYQNILIPASSQGYYPILAPNPPKFDLSQDAAGGVVKIIFVNFPLFPTVPASSGGGSSGTDITAIGGEAVTGPNLPVEIVAPSPVPVSSSGPTITDYTHTLASTDPEELFASGQAAKYMFIVNPSLSANAVTIFIDGGTTGEGIELVPGASFELVNGLANAVNVVGEIGTVVVAYGGA